MKKYILFAYDKCYPQGGLDDVIDSFDTLDEAVKESTEGKRKHYDFHEVVDRDTWEKVWCNY